MPLASGELGGLPLEAVEDALRFGVPGAEVLLSGVEVFLPARGDVRAELLGGRIVREADLEPLLPRGVLWRRDGGRPAPLVLALPLAIPSAGGGLEGKSDGVAPGPAVPILLELREAEGVDVDLERAQLVAVVGPSGSGKTSLVFDTIHAESQRRYLDVLGWA